MKNDSAEPIGARADRARYELGLPAHSNGRQPNAQRCG